jgi:steroid delta-isomerase-like uncharacterized protein
MLAPGRVNEVETWRRAHRIAISTIAQTNTERDKGALRQMSEQNKALTRRFYDEAIGQRSFDLIDELVADDFVEHEAFPGLSPDKDGVKAFFAMLLEAFPDIQFIAEDIIAEGDKVAARLTITGTHQGTFLDIPPTGKKITLSAIDIMRYRDGKAVEHWGVTDQAAMMEQLGVMAG